MVISKSWSNAVIRVSTVAPRLERPTLPVRETGVPRHDGAQLWPPTKPSRR